MVTLIKLEELKREQEKVYKELVKIKEEERELFIKLQDLKTIEGMKRLQFLQYSNKIAVLEVNEAKKEVSCIKKFNENKKISTPKRRETKCRKRYFYVFKKR